MEPAFTAKTHGRHDQPSLSPSVPARPPPQHWAGPGHLSFPRLPPLHLQFPTPGTFFPDGCASLTWLFLSAFPSLSRPLKIRGKRASARIFKKRGWEKAHVGAPRPLITQLSAWILSRGCGWGERSRRGSPVMSTLSPRPSGRTPSPCSEPAPTRWGQGTFRAASEQQVPLCGLAMR